MGALFIEPSIPPLRPRTDDPEDAAGGLGRSHHHVQALHLGGHLGIDDNTRQKFVRLAATLGGMVGAGLSIALIVYFVKVHRSSADRSTTPHTAIPTGWMKF